MTKSFTILDGGMGRELQRIGAPFQQPEWSAKALIEDPSWITRAHQNFIDAGAEIITVNAYACVPFHLGAELFQEKGAELIQLAARLAQEVAQKNRETKNITCRVAGSLPPVFGSYRPDLFDAKNADRILQTLIEQQKEYVDFWLVETTSSWQEAEAALHALDRYADRHQKIYLSFTLQDVVSDAPRLRSGELLQTVVDAVLQTNVNALLFNCSIPELMIHALNVSQETIRHHQSELKLGVYPNAFTPIGDQHVANGSLQSLREIQVDEYQHFAQEWLDAGASIIGGCCGITPEHIAGLSALKSAATKR